MNKQRNIDQLYIVAPGILDDKMEEDILKQIALNISHKIKTISTFNIATIHNVTNILIKNYITKLMNKSPLIKVNIFTS